MIMKKGDCMNALQKILKNFRFQRFLILLITFLVLLLLGIKNVIPQKYDLKEGQISPVDIKSPRDFIDEIATKEKMQMAISNVPLQYSKSDDMQKDAINKAKQFFNFLLEQQSSSESISDKVKKIENTFTLNIEDKDIVYLLKQDYSTLVKLSDLLSGILNDLSKFEILQNDEESFNKALDFYKQRIQAANLDNNLKDIMIKLAPNFIKPNMFIDIKKTNELQELVKKQVEPVYVRKNQVIVSKGQVINSAHIYLLNKAGVLKNNSKTDVGNYISLISIILLSEFLIVLYLFKYKSNVYKNISYFILIFILICLNMLFVSATNVISKFLIPVAFMPIVLTMVFEYELAFFVFIISSLIVIILTNFSLEVFVIYVFGGLIGTIFLRDVYERRNIMLGGILIGFINSLIILSLGLISGSELSQVFLNMLYGIVGGLISSILAIGIMPIFEQIFDLVTPIKLMELSNPNQPLLKKVLFEAPGTYHHSILVGNLAEAAAESIGANSLLARVGAYYHDIGKIKRPYFFKENQIINDNPHDNLTPKLSAMIISAHVKDGIELANEYKLPSVIKQIIEEHHGTTLIKYFYAVAKQNGEDVDDKIFRYPGPKPKSKESAIVMLADCVEAAVRSMGSVTLEDIENMVDKIIKDKIEDGQLDESNLTLKDILNIKKSFINVLQGIFHNRIEYPDITKEGD